MLKSKKWGKGKGDKENLGSVDKKKKGKRDSF